MARPKKANLVFSSAWDGEFKACFALGLGTGDFRSSAKFTGEWSKTSLVPCVGAGAKIAGPKTKGEARFEFSVPSAGKYEVRLFWAGHENRSSKTTCVLERTGQANITKLLNQRETAPKGLNVLGTFDFTATTKNTVVFKTDGADGNVVADAIQVVPVP